ncbi:Leucine-rich repeat (LRR) protein [Streptomyces auratus]
MPIPPDRDRQRAARRPRNNALPAVPEALCGLPLLRWIDLRGNRIEAVPPWMALLPSLEKLDLRWNAVEDTAEPVLALREKGCVVLT